MKFTATIRTRRTPEQRIADLQKQIEAIKTRAAAKTVKQSPSLRHVKAAMKSIGKAMSASDDNVLRQALGEARTTLSACMAMQGVLMPATISTPRAQRAGSNSAIAPDDLLTYVALNPRQRGEQIAAALSVDGPTMRVAMHKLIADGKVRTAGKARGMTYAAT